MEKQTIPHGLSVPIVKEGSNFHTRVGEALREVGFFAYEGHGLNPQLIERAYEACHQFFDLPLADKQKVTGVSERGQPRGYASVDPSVNHPHLSPEFKEAWHM